MVYQQSEFSGGLDTTHSKLEPKIQQIKMWQLDTISWLTVSKCSMFWSLFSFHYCNCFINYYYPSSIEHLLLPPNTSEAAPPTLVLWAAPPALVLQAAPPALVLRAAPPALVLLVLRLLHNTYLMGDLCALNCITHTRCKGGDQTNKLPSYFVHTLVIKKLLHE